MSVDTDYKPIPYIYKSRGLIARNIEDQAPEHTYLDMQNCLEREEDAMSSRYGTQIICRDPIGTGTSNYYFNQPVTSLSRLNYQASAWRYAGLSDGSLYRRTGNTQGAYTQIYSGLSGQPFQSLVTNCFETSIPYNFIYDQAASIKDTGTLAAPQLTGIDPPPQTANSVPYSPLLTLIDNFASGNTYTASGFSGSFAYSPITTITAGSGQIVTDFTQFLDTGTPLTGGSVVHAQTVIGTGSSSAIFSGFPSVPITPGQLVSITVSLAGSIVFTGTGNAEGQIAFFYSTDSGATFPNVLYISPGVNFFGPGTYNFPPQIVTVSVPGLTNLDTVEFQALAFSTVSSGTMTATTTATYTSIEAGVADPGVFGDVCNGIISVLNTNTSINVPIASIVSSGFADNAYLNLTVTTASPHGLTGSNVPVGIYGSSNDLTDGFYFATVTGTTTLTVPFYSADQIGSLGGTLVGGAAAPAECVLINEYTTPYPTQFSAWGFYQEVPTTTTSFPIGCFTGAVGTNTTATVGKTVNVNLNINNQTTDDDLIVLTLQVSDPGNVENIRLQFDINGSGYTSNYYYKDISPAYYQQGVSAAQNSYEVTQNQIFADTLNLITGQPPGTTSAQLQPSNFSTGSDAWIAVYMRRGDFLPVGQAGQSGLDWTNITGWQLVVTTSTTGGSSISVNGLYFQWGYGPSSFGGVGYDYRYTYYNAFTGTESNGSPEQAFGGTQFGYLSSQTAPIYLRQAVQITGAYSLDTQVTHVRIYRRGGTRNSNWVNIDQIPNLSLPGSLINFTYKDVIPDAFIEQAQILVLDNDPPVTSSLSSPIQTTLSAATAGPGNLYYNTFSAQAITVADSSAVFVANQIVDIGPPSNLEQVYVINGGVGTFTAIVRLQHNQGDPVNVYAIPRQPCNLCAFAYNQVWLAGDPNNPHYLYYSKKGLPENFGPQNYIPVSTPDDPINAVINWRGTLIVGTLKTWKIIVGGPQPYAQPTGSVHGIIAQQGWAEVEGAIWYRAADGLREFTGADGVYKSLPVEWIFKGNPQCIPPQADNTQASQDVMAYYDNVIYHSYISLTNGGQRFRLQWDTQYARFRYDDVPATAMLWEKDINTLLVGKHIASSNYAVVQDQINDYDDGGWAFGELAMVPIDLVIQSPYRDLGKPHNPKQWNQYETDVNTENQNLDSTLLFEDGAFTLPLATVNTGTSRQKVELFVNNGAGEQAYRASIQHAMLVTVAPTIYQENIYAAVLAEYSASLDSYWIKFGTDESKFVKQAYFDYNSTVPLDVSLYADNSATPYYTFTLPAQATRGVIRVRFGNNNPGTTAFTMRTFRMIILETGSVPPNNMQMWEKIKIEWKPIGAGNTYRPYELET